MSISKVQLKDEEYALAASSGMRRRIVKWEAAEAWPPLMEYIQEAGHAGDKDRKGESKMQIVLKIHKEAVQLMRKSNDGKCDWQRAERKVNRSKPLATSEVSHLRVYVQNCAGGSGGPRP